MPRLVAQFPVLLCLVSSGILGCRVSNIPLFEPIQPSRELLEVERIEGVPYGDEPEPGSHRRDLDLFLPKGQKDFPVVLLVHGGAWMIGDNSSWGLYTAVGNFLASHGIGAVLPNYRLSPRIQHPEHIKDIAQAFAWTYAHSSAYGGSAKQIFVAGHSAGGHLAALLATDDTWLNDHGLDTTNVKGVICLSGVYHIPPRTPVYAWGGAGPFAFRLGQILPLRSESNRFADFALLPGVPLYLNVFCPAFGDDPELRENASPVNHVRPGLPPFLLIYAEHDLPTLPEMTDEFHHALLQQGNTVTLLRADKRNHNSTMFKAPEKDDPVGMAILDFIHLNALPASETAQNR